jgi:hypothetical protein
MPRQLPRKAERLSIEAWVFISTKSEASCVRSRIGQPIVITREPSDNAEPEPCARATRHNKQVRSSSWGDITSRDSV